MEPEPEPEPKLRNFFGSGSGSSQKGRLRAAPAPKHCFVGKLQSSVEHDFWLLLIIFLFLKLY